jgi:hypothetical protein
MEVRPEDPDRQLNELMLWHAQLRENLELQLWQVSEIERRFLSYRPADSTNEVTRRELRRKMVLAKPWREELNVTYKALLQTTIELDQAVQKIHNCQTNIASTFIRK